MTIRMAAMIAPTSAIYIVNGCVWVSSPRRGVPVIAKTDVPGVSASRRARDRLRDIHHHDIS